MISRKSFRNLILQVHLWIGIASALFLFLAGASGALLVFEEQIDGILNPGLTRVTPSGNILSLTDLKESLERQYPGYRALGFSLAESPSAAYGAYLQPASGQGIGVAVNPYTGKALGVWDQNRFVQRLHLFHTRLLAGEVGSDIVAWASVILVLLSLSGLFLWWRSKVFGFHFQSEGAKFQYDLHSTVGVVSMMFLLAFALTGIVVHWEGPARKWANQISKQEVRMPIPAVAKPMPGATPLDPARLLQAARVAVPGARPTGINLPEDEDSPVMVGFKFPEDHTPAGRTRVFLNPYTGGVLSLTSSREAPAAVSYVTRINREIHTGDIGGRPTRIVAAIFSLSLPLLAISGPLLWWYRRQRS